MAVLVAAVVILGVLCLVNLVFTLGVIRRLREHSELLGPAGGGPEEMLAPAGGRVADFTATAVDGRTVTVESLTGVTLVGFFSTDCPSCAERLPRFVDAAERHVGGAERVLAVVVGHDDEAAAPFVEDLSPVATVVRDAGDGKVRQAFGLRGFPAFGLVDQDGSVLSSSVDPSALSTPVAP